MSSGSKCLVVLIGNVGRSVDSRNLPSGGLVTNITVATTERWKDKQTGQPQERTEWHRVVFFNRLAEIAAEYLRKGAKVYIEGKLRTRKWQDQSSGQDRYTTEIIADEMQMLDSLKNTNQNAGSGAAQGASSNSSTEQPSDQSPPPNNGPGGAPDDFSSFDDDIPFG